MLVWVSSLAGRWLSRSILVLLNTTLAHCKVTVQLGQSGVREGYRGTGSRYIESTSWNQADDAVWIVQDHVDKSVGTGSHIANTSKIF